MTRAIFLFFALVALSGCATPYQGIGYTGGYSELSGPGALEKVSFYGNSHVDASTVQQYALYRCAELAKERNRPYFKIYDSLISASLDRPSALPNVGTVGGKPAAFAFVLMLEKFQEGAKETEIVLLDLQPAVK